MDWKVIRLNQELRRYDRSLFAQKQGSGMIQVWRKADKWSASDLSYDETQSSNPMHFVLALTHNWTVSGQCVDWGLEPVMARIHEMDLWSKQSFLDDLRKQRDRAKAIREQSNRNEIRARASDMRKEFAEATNEINTSTLEKVDSRRTKYGNC
jgi:hypothetical protein